MNISYKITAVFHGSTITIPFVEPILLKGTREDGNFAFIFSHNAENYYIFATLQQGVINNNLPNYLDPSIKELFIETVHQYCESSRQGLPDNLFIAHLKKNALCLRNANTNRNSASSQCST